MNKTIKAVRRKIAKLNDKIDLKIINGLPFSAYKRESDEHRRLMQYLVDVR